MFQKHKNVKLFDLQIFYQTILTNMRKFQSIGVLKYKNFLLSIFIASFYGKIVKCVSLLLKNDNVY